jgi:hypothetical protein
MARNLPPLSADEMPAMDEACLGLLGDQPHRRVDACRSDRRGAERPVMDARGLGRPDEGLRTAGKIGLVLALAAGAAACDGTYRPTEAADASNGTATASVRVRLEGGTGLLPDASVLAFKATLRGPASRDVLGLVDPLASEPPLRDCELRDLAAGAADMVSHGNSVDLEELPGLTVTFNGADGAAAALRPSARLFPDITAALGGVVSESGPTPLSALPATVTVETNDGEGRVPTASSIALPSWPHLKIAAETSKAGVISFSASQDLAIGVTPAAATTLELRPFGTTALLTCAVPAPSAENADATVIIHKALLARLAARSVEGRAGATVPLAFDVVRRTAGKLGTATGSPDLVVEVRLSGTAELRP